MVQQIIVRGLNANASITAAQEAAGEASDAATIASVASTAAAAAASSATAAKVAAEQAEAAAEALVISDLGTTDGQTRALIEAPSSQTAQALSATYAVPRQVRSQIVAGAGDQTAVLQAEIDNLAGEGGLLLVDEGTFTFTGTITIPPRVVISGAAGTGSPVFKGTIFQHTPGAPTPFIKNGAAAIPGNGLTNNIGLKSVALTGNANSTVGLDLLRVAYSEFTDLTISGFGTNLRVDELLVTTFARVRSTAARTVCLYLTRAVSASTTTTTTFLDCYLGQTSGDADSRPLIADNDCCLGVVFDRLVMESAELGASLGSGNVIDFRSIYTENIPNAPAPQPVFEIGRQGPPDVLNQGGIYSFSGGTIAGSNYGVDSDSSIFDVDYCHALTVTGVRLSRANTAVKQTANTQTVTFVGTTDVQVANGVQTDPDIVRIGNYSGSYTARFPDTYASNTPTTGIFALNAAYAGFGGANAPRAVLAAGLVVLEGLTARNTGNLTSDDVVLTLAEGFRPAGSVQIGVATEGASRIVLRVDPDGTVNVVAGTAATWLSLAGIVFAAA